MLGLTSLAGAAEPPAPSIELTYEQFVAQCAKPEQSQVQRAPREIRLVCSSREVTWLAAQPGSIPLAGSRSVSTSLLSDKFKVSTGTRELPVTARAGTCHRFEEVIETYTSEIPLTCEDVMGFKAPIAEYCASQLDEGKDNNPKAVSTERTGRIVDTCGQAVAPRG